MAGHYIQKKDHWKVLQIDRRRLSLHFWQFLEIKEVSPSLEQPVKVHSLWFLGVPLLSSDSIILIDRLFPVRSSHTLGPHYSFGSFSLRVDLHQRQVIHPLSLHLSVFPFLLTDHEAIFISILLLILSLSNIRLKRLYSQ